MANNYQANIMNLTGATTGGTPVPLLWQYTVNSFEALVSNMSGSTEPTYTQPYMTWVNSVTNTEYYIEPVSGASVILENMSQYRVLPQNASFAINLNNHKQLILCDASAGAITVTLNNFAASNYGLEFTLKKVDSSTNIVNIVFAGGTIEGSTSMMLTEPFESVTLVYDTAKYYKKAVTTSAKYKSVDTVINYNVSIHDNDKVVFVNNTLASQVNLPAVASLPSGFHVTIKKLSGASLDVTIIPQASEFIDGAASKVLTTQYETIKLMVHDNINWYTI